MIIPKRQLNAFLIIWGMFLLGLLVCLSAFTINRIKNETKYNNALIENLGKPVIYEQHYFAPK
jgi:hypothetical protein